MREAHGSLTRGGIFVYPRDTEYPGEVCTFSPLPPGDDDAERRVQVIVSDPICRAREFAINASNQRFWEPPVQRYVEECLQGKEGPRGRDFNMRWVAS